MLNAMALGTRPRFPGGAAHVHAFLGMLRRMPGPIGMFGMPPMFGIPWIPCIMPAMPCSACRTARQVGRRAAGPQC